MPNRPRVLIVDDSPTFRRLLHGLLDADPRVEVVGEAADGVEASAAAIALLPDVITMDVNMPRMNGLQAVREIMSTQPTRILVLATVEDSAAVDLTFRAVGEGALELLPKPNVSNATELSAWGRRAIEAILLMAEIPVIRRRRRSISRGPLTHTERARAVGIASSAGGPVALAKVLGKLGDIQVPVLIAQHIAAGFTAGLQRFLNDASAIPIEIAVDGAQPHSGVAYLAPDGCHIEVDDAGRLRTVPGDELLVPCADRLLTSLANVYGAATLGIVLTGMGDDGAVGLLRIRQAGGITAIQDKATSMVFGMPGAALNIGATDNQLSIDAIAPFVRGRCSPHALNPRGSPR